MKIRTTEEIFCTFYFIENKVALAKKTEFLASGFSLQSEYFPVNRKDGQGYFEVSKTTEVKPNNTNAI